jgi:outer membrane protein
MNRGLPLLRLGLMMALFLCVLPQGLSAAEYTLADIYRIALQNAEQIKISQENLAISETGKDKAMALLYPRLSSFASYTRFSQAKYGESTTLGPYTLPGPLIQPSESGTWGARLDESLSLSGREFTALTISKENIQKTIYDLESFKQEYLLNVASTYYNVLKARKNLDIANANVERLAKYRDAAEKRLKVGEVTKTVLLRAEAELSGALSDRMTVKNGLELAIVQLKRVVASNEDFQIRETPEMTIEIPAVSAFQTTALSERTDLKGLEIQKKVAEDQVRFAKGAYWPSLSLSGVYSGADQSPISSTFNRESIYAGAALNFPIFEGGLRVAEVKEARSKEKQSQLLYEDLKKTIEVEVQSAYLDLVTQKAIFKFLEDQQAFAKDNYQAITRQFEYGLAQSIDIIDANTLLVSAERKVSEAGYNYQVAILKMKRATGVLLKEILAAR